MYVPVTPSNIKVRTAGGLGDVLLMTPSFRALKQLSPQSRLSVYCEKEAHYDLLRGNPYIDVLERVSQADIARLWRAVWSQVKALSGRRGVRLPRSIQWVMRKLDHGVPFYGTMTPMLSGRHATQLIGEILNQRIADQKLEVHLSNREELAAKDILRGFMNPVILGISSSTSLNQHWAHSNWEQLVRRNPQYTFVQCGLESEPKIEGAVDLRGKTTVREAVALLKHAKSFVGVVSFLAHAAGAVGTAGVVLFGPSTPQVWGHSTNKNITKSLRCSPCIDLLNFIPCPYGAQCMSAITVEEIEAALREQISVSVSR